MDPFEAAIAGYVTVYAHPDDADEKELRELRDGGARVILTSNAPKGEITFSTGRSLLEDPHAGHT